MEKKYPAFTPSMATDGFPSKACNRTLLTPSGSLRNSLFFIGQINWGLAEELKLNCLPCSLRRWMVGLPADREWTFLKINCTQTFLLMSNDKYKNWQHSIFFAYISEVLRFGFQIYLQREIQLLGYLSLTDQDLPLTFFISITAHISGCEIQTNLQQKQEENERMENMNEN